MIDRDELAAWLRLVETPGIGRESVRRLLAAFGSPEGVIGASVAARSQVVSREAALALAQPFDGCEALVEATLRWLEAATGAGPEVRDVVVLGDPRYPQALLETADPPLVLYARGRIELLAAPQIAIVGSRSATPQGIENARAFGAHLSAAGWTITSGLALGIDGAAHEGALRGPGKTVAVVGSGLDQDYPTRHRALARRIASDGLIVSEFAIGTPPLPPNFPIRNRIIAGLSRAVLVVEAAVQSGSLITARLAAEAGRDVFAIPGSIHSPQSRGCHALIKQGAKLVDQAADIESELAGGGLPSATAPPAAAGASGANPAGAAGDHGETGVDSPGRDGALLSALGYDPVGIDSLVARTGRSAAALSAALLELELSGRVARLPGQLFQRVGRG